MARRRTLITYLAVYFFAISTAIRGLNSYRDLPSMERVAGLLAAFFLLLVIEPWVSRRSRRYTRLYLAVQTGITSTLLLTSPYEDFWAVLFVSLGLQAMHLLPPRTGFQWIGLFTVVTAVLLINGLGWSEGLTRFSTYPVAFFAVGLLLTVARQAETAREESQRLLTELQDAHQQLQAYAAQAALINQVGQRVSGELELETLLSEIVTAVQDAFGYYNVMLLLLDADGERLTIQSIAGGYADVFPTGLRIAVGEGMTGYAAASGKTQVSGDVSADPHFVRKEEEETRSELAVPICGASRRDKRGRKIIGVLDIQSDALDAFDQTDVVAMETLSTQIATAIENARLYEAAQRELAERVRAQEALRESEDMLKMAIEAANVGFFHVKFTPDETVLIRDWTPGRGDEPDETESTVEAWAQMEPVHPDDREKWMEAWDRYVAGEAPLFEVEHRARTESGEWVWMLQRGQVVARDEHGQPLRVAGMYQDVTERVQAQEALREAQAAAEDARRAAERSAHAAVEANRAKSVFLANMSHELRTPLNAILGFAHLMTRDPGLTAEQRENLETIGRSGEHLLGLINDVLELSKIEAGRVALHEECFDLHRLLNGLEEMFHLRAREKDLMLIFDRAPVVPQFVRADEGKLRQVLMNLLGNAVKFTQEGGATLRVGCTPSVSSAIGGEALKRLRLFFEVEDTGPGIEPQELDAVFDPFKQTASGQMSHEGTGLGMPISRQFVRLMGGDLTVSSELGVGTLFKFDVQIELADAADVPTSHPKRRVIALEPDQPVYRLLVVEDREANRKLLVKLLAPLGFEMQEAVNGQQGIEVWERWQPHLIWMDMRMPVMDGYEATQRIKCTTQGQATVVVALTASAFESDRAMILSGGCDDYVRKPFREEEVFDMLTKHLGVRFVYEEAAQPIGVPTKAAEALLTPEALAALPAGWVTNLHQAAIQLDADLILDLLDQIREGNAPLADALEGLVHDFRFDTIMTLTQRREC